MEEAKTYILGDNAGNSALPWIAAMNGNMGVCQQLTQRGLRYD